MPRQGALADGDGEVLGGGAGAVFGCDGDGIGPSGTGFGRTAKGAGPGFEGDAGWKGTGFGQRWLREAGDTQLEVKALTGRGRRLVVGVDGRGLVNLERKCHSAGAAGIGGAERNGVATAGSGLRCATEAKCAVAILLKLHVSGQTGGRNLGRQVCRDFYWDAKAHPGRDGFCAELRDHRGLEDGEREGLRYRGRAALGRKRQVVDANG